MVFVLSSLSYLIDSVVLMSLVFKYFVHACLCLFVFLAPIDLPYLALLSLTLSLPVERCPRNESSSSIDITCNKYIPVVFVIFSCIAAEH